MFWQLSCRRNVLLIIWPFQRPFHIQSFAVKGKIIKFVNDAVQSFAACFYVSQCVTDTLYVQTLYTLYSRVDTKFRDTKFRTKNSFRISRNFQFISRNKNGNCQRNFAKIKKCEISRTFVSSNFVSTLKDPIFQYHMCLEALSCFLMAIFA